jgi:Acyclic terpene utilisation family protein AtuA
MCRGDGSDGITAISGLIDRAAVARQRLYEIGAPGAYVLPDVVCDFRHVHIEQ